MPPVTTATLCAMYPPSAPARQPLRALLFDVAPRRRFDLAVNPAAERAARRHLGSAVLREPVSPVLPPAPGPVSRGGEPAVRVLLRQRIQPVIATVLGRWIDDAGNVPARR